MLVLGLVGSAMAGPTAGLLTGEERRNRLGQALGILGALVAGFGVILFFAANWSDIPRPLRVLLLLAALVASFAAGFALREVYGRANVGHALIFLGTVLFGASVFLVGQMYNVQAHDPLGFLLWAAGAFAIAFLVRSGPIAALAILSFFAWLIHELVDATESYDAAIVVPAYLALYGAALYGLGTGAQRWLERLRFARPVRILGFVFLVAGLLPLTFREAHEFGDADPVLDINRVAVTVAGLAAAAGIGVVALPILRQRQRVTALAEAGVLLGCSVLVLAAVLWPEVSRDGGLRDRATVYPLLFNLAVAVVAFGALVVGMLLDEVWLSNAGAATVGVDLLARFFSSDWSMLERGIVFMLVGVGVLALAALLERR
ncbi:MAG TPA: DUF2157 domain-containing protein, partial [Gaiellaceae bacterium]|nr:DUF2157 domain-containing protein [Gaiellaceae bacterium]